MRSCYRLLILSCISALVLTALTASAFALPDLVVTKNDITVLKQNGMTYVTVVVHNNGNAAAGSFTLRITASKSSSSSWGDFQILGIAASGQASRTANFNGTDWTCASGDADTGDAVSESSESNNYANINNIWISIAPGGIRDVIIGVPNPGATTETVNFYVSPPSGWTASVNPSQLTLAPDEFQTTTVHFEAPVGFVTQEVIQVLGEFQDGTPGTMDYLFHINSTVPADNSTWGKVKALYEF